jgi:hypothetical protein
MTVHTAVRAVKAILSGDAHGWRLMSRHDIFLKKAVDRLMVWA